MDSKLWIEIEIEIEYYKIETHIVWYTVTNNDVSRIDVAVFCGTMIVFMLLSCWITIGIRCRLGARAALSLHKINGDGALLVLIHIIYYILSFNLPGFYNYHT